MKIGLVTPALGFQGGLELHAHQLGQALSARGHEVRLLHGPRIARDPLGFAAPFASTASVDQAGATSGLDVVWVEKAHSADDLIKFGELPVLVAVHDHDLTCLRTSRTLLVGRAACERPPGASCVAHGCVVVRDRGSAFPLSLASPFTLRHRLAALAGRAPLVACSRFVARTLIEAGAPPGRVSAIHPLPPEDPTPLKARPGASRLLVAAQLVHGKGVDLAIEALAHLPPEVTLEIAGDGPERGALEAQARAFPGRVGFAGYVRPEQMAARYDAASVVVVPSRWPEPFGLIGVEAMRRGRPVVAALHGGIPEWLAPQPGGAGFQPGNARDLARAARSVLEDRLAGAEARLFAQAHLAQPRAIDQVELLLAAAARQGPLKVAS